MRPSSLPCYDVTDPRRPITVPQCTSCGRWCRDRWRGVGDLCLRPYAAPACPELVRSAVPAFELVRRLAEADETDAVVVKFAGEGWTVRGLWERWQRPEPPGPDVLDLAGETGACAACGWRCRVCAGPGRGKGAPAECRSLNGACALAEVHVAECPAAQVRWLGPHRSVINASPRPSQARAAPPAARAPTRRARRQAVRRWVRAQAPRP